MLDARRLLPRNQTVCGFILARITEVDPAEPSRTLLRPCELVRTCQLKPRYVMAPREQAPDVHRRLEDRPLVGEVVLEP
jgi:NADPH2:quinone reductase